MRCVLASVYECGEIHFSDGNNHSVFINTVRSEIRGARVKGIPQLKNP
jgi:hypothetical protein